MRRIRRRWTRRHVADARGQVDETQATSSRSTPWTVADEHVQRGQVGHRQAGPDRSELLGRTDAARSTSSSSSTTTPRPSYAGDIAGLAATSPQRHRPELTGTSPAEQAYAAYTGEHRQPVPRRRRRQRSRRVGGRRACTHGVRRRRRAACRPTRSSTLLALPERRRRAGRRPATSRRPTRARLHRRPDDLEPGGRSGPGRQGRDLRRPRHRHLAGAPIVRRQPGPRRRRPPHASGDPRPCVFGDNPLTRRPTSFECNHKLIGGQPFLDTYNLLDRRRAVPGLGARQRRARHPHHEHRGRRHRQQRPIFGIDRGPISGVAPGAWVHGVQGVRRRRAASTSTRPQPSSRRSSTAPT